jgi:hypothetical protein
MDASSAADATGTGVADGADEGADDGEGEPRESGATSSPRKNWSYAT